MRPKSILVGAILSISCLAVQMVASDEKSADRPSQIKTQKSPNGDPKQRPPGLTLSSSSIQKSQQTGDESSKSASAKAKAAKKTKFQSRIMRSTQHAGLAEGHGDSVFSSDSLVPTFIDQEQGDDMVALASDSAGESQLEPAQQVKVLPQVNRSLHSNSYMKRYQADRQQRESDADERYLRELDQGKGSRTSQPADDYYADEDEEDEEQPIIATTKSQHSDSRQASKGTQAERSSTTVSYTQPKTADFSVGEFASHPAQKYLENKTELSVVQRDKSVWLPTIGKQLQQAAAQSQETTARRPGGTDRLVGLFGGRETISTSLTKTDMAIEYLRNILKTKQGRQQAANNATSIAQPDQGAAQEPAPDKGLKTFYPLPVQFREFAQVANKTGELKSSNGTQKVAAFDQTSTKQISLKQQDSSGKFSIGDVKQPGQQQTAPAVPNSPPSPTPSPASIGASRQTGDEIRATQTQFPTTAKSVSPSNIRIGGIPFELPFISPANGTPLGGDYIEGQDDFPRAYSLSVPQVAQQSSAGQKEKVETLRHAPEIQQQQTKSIQQDSGDQMSVLASEHSGTRAQTAYTGGQHPFGSQQAASGGQANSGQPQAISSVYFQMQLPPARSRAEYPREQRPSPVEPFAHNVQPQPPKGVQVQPAQQNFDFDQANLDEPKLVQQTEQIPDNAQQVEPAALVGGTKTVKPMEMQTFLDQIDEFGVEEPKQGKSSERPSGPVHHQVPNQQDQQQVTVDHHPQQMISSKLYRNEHLQPQPQPQQQPQPQPQPQAHQHHYHHHYHQQPLMQTVTHPQADRPHELPPPPSMEMHFKGHHQHHQPRGQPGQQTGAYSAAPYGQEVSRQVEHHQAKSRLRPPKIVSYNYYESPNEPSGQPTNFQFGDSLLSSTGDVEHTLSSAELEAIQSQFMTAEHPLVPLGDHHEHRDQHSLDMSLPRLLANLKSGSPELLHKLVSTHGSSADPLKGLASTVDERPAAEHEQGGQEKQKRPDDGDQAARALDSRASLRPAQGRDQQQLPSVKSGEKRKSLVVYLNHPRSGDMTRAASAGEEGLAQLISEQTSGDPFVSAREFDSRGLSKDTKHLDVSNLRGLGGQAKEAADKDGLSVVVIGDAYKYKKIVLLISAKSGGLKFIPMVKDMKR